MVQRPKVKDQVYDYLMDKRRKERRRFGDEEWEGLTTPWEMERFEKRAARSDEG